jgi:predicted nucleic acid-binding protein
VAEIESGIFKCLRESATRKGRDLTDWLDAVTHGYAGRILGIRMDEARLAGRLIEVASAASAASDFADILIAATAQLNGLTVLTRNLRHFLPVGVAAVDPFVALPASLF